MVADLGSGDGVRLPIVSSSPKDASVQLETSSSDESEDDSDCSSTAEDDDVDERTISNQNDITSTVVKANNSVVHVGDKTIVINQLNVPQNFTNLDSSIVQYLDSIDSENPPEHKIPKDEIKKGTFIGGTVIKAMALSVTLTLVLVAFIVVLQLMQIGSQNVPLSPDPPNDGTSSNGTLVSRTRCELLKPLSGMRKMKMIPPTAVVISHTAGNQCFSEKYCCELVRNIQTSHQTINGFADIGYHYLLGGDGRIYEGRPWDEEGAHTKDWNCCAVGISFIGNFINEVPTEKQAKAGPIFLAKLVEDGKLALNYSLFYHKQLSNTESPGPEVIDIVKRWSHWTKHVPPVSPCL